MRCVNLEREPIQSENMTLLMEILTLKTDLRELYLQKGPGNSDYISLSLKLDKLINEYFEEKLQALNLYL
ncbi:Spo0E family sporulation regulatory protein-aspartic acid phosphatase [Neobacillus sp. LXY-4]|uniref:Spo0E family sporulation regulatory protein-aspartic acid phosphatase n=1 Tax=Neobacillus sp. LXY-4 TaxID=3379826 RepID=UPI003EE1BF3F